MRILLLHIVNVIGYSRYFVASKSGDFTAEFVCLHALLMPRVQLSTELVHGRAKVVSALCHNGLRDTSKAVYAGLYALLFYVGLLSPPIKKGVYIRNGLIISIRFYSGKWTALTCLIYTPAQALDSGAYNPPVGP